MSVMGIDIGGSAIKAAPVDVDKGRLSAERSMTPTPQPATPEAIATSLHSLTRDCARSAKLIGCGLPAAIQNGIVRTAANIDRSWIGVRVEDLFKEATGCAVTVLNDADAAGLAEMRFGQGRDEKGTVMVITVGTGLGSALFRRGTLVPNTELGHLILQGQVAETYASAAVKTRLGLSYAEWVPRLDSYLQRLRELFWPDLFIIGGGISEDFARIAPLLTVKTPTRPALLGNDAGIIGAAMAAVENV